jgi:hypothetical protein
MYQMTEELKAKVAAIFDQEIDPDYVKLAKIIEPKLGDNPRYLPAILVYAITRTQLEIIFALPDTDRDPGLKDWEVSDSFAKKMQMPKEQIDEEVRELYLKGHVYTKQNTLNLAAPSSFWIYVQHRNKLSRHPYGDEYYYALSLYAANLDDVGNVMCQCNKDTCIELRRPMHVGSSYPVWDAVAVWRPAQKMR